jgi:RNA polymerase sigma-70 factor (ECF subfamily)
MTDGELVRRILRGERAAAEDLASRWAVRMLAFCQARVRNRHTAEDLAQESLLRGLRSLRSLESPERFGTWLCGIAAHVCLDWRKAKQSAQVPLSTYAPDRRPEELFTDSQSEQSGVDRADEVRWLLAAVETLSVEHREVLLLYYYQDVTYQDLAEMLGVSAATINARLTQARARLRERLGNSNQLPAPSARAQKVL